MKKLKIRAENVEVRPCIEVGINDAGECLIITKKFESAEEFVIRNIGGDEATRILFFQSEKYSKKVQPILAAIILRSGAIEPEDVLWEGEYVEGRGLQTL